MKFVPSQLESLSFQEILDLAWKARAENRPYVFDLVCPVKTMAVSVTGKACSLNCSHCGGRYLKHMVDINEMPSEFAKRKPKSILLSGGCDKSGAVPLVSSFEKVLSCTKHSNVRINAHPGIVSEEEAKQISKLASAISFDFVMDEEAIQEAFHGHWTRDDYIRTFRNLRKGKAEVVPHILIGLLKGRISGEYEALNFLFKENISKVIFIVFIPTPGTEWEYVSPPDIEDVIKVIAWARISKPDLHISLGCMRPKGKYREELDKLAVQAGVDSVVLPHPRAVQEARNRGLKIIRKDECCAFG